jgi:uncharacterized protein involved in outer membrane biogenesis
MSNQQENQQETVYWDPNAEITISGVELATLIQIIDLQHVNLNAIPFSALAELINGANQVKSAIIERMNNQGLLSSKPVESLSGSDFDVEVTTED